MLANNTKQESLLENSDCHHPGGRWKEERVTGGKQLEKSEVRSMVRNENSVVGLEVSAGPWWIRPGGDVESHVLEQRT